MAEGVSQVSSPPDRDVSAGLERWAADRAPELIARAEAEAVAVLRDALVTAGLRDMRRSSASTPRSRRRATPRDLRVGVLRAA